ncbi:hypothetical protein M0813_12619 [Anaeramoeba flamelloides]|uniref:Uncharacterized protein n=1 Tax=Anaeramoeba flamelloides TaxID=1746091 RepID=A0ABQ8ZB00_9EUKA|nr:hypothetical protein M0813_12619 [Anaeramoeba flamelloides]
MMSVKKIKSTPILESRLELQENQIRSKSDFLFYQRLRPNLIVPQPIKKFPSQNSPTEKLEIDFSKEIDKLVSPIYKTTCIKSSTFKNFDNFDLEMDLENEIILEEKIEPNMQKLKRHKKEEENDVQVEEEEYNSFNNISHSTLENLKKTSTNKKPILPFSPPLRSKCPFHNNNQFF